MITTDDGGFRYYVFYPPCVGKFAEDIGKAEFDDALHEHMRRVVAQTATVLVAAAGAAGVETGGAAGAANGETVAASGAAAGATGVESGETGGAAEDLMGSEATTGRIASV